MARRSSSAMSLSFLLAQLLLLHKVTGSDFWCDKNFSWERMNSRERAIINDCDLLEDRLTLHLDHLVSVVDCVKSVTLEIEGVRQQFIIGGTENVLSVENPIEGPSENPELNRCTAVPVEIEVELPSGEKRATHITLNPMSCFDDEKHLTYAEGEGQEIQLDLREHGLFKTRALWETCLTSITIEDLDGRSLAYDYLHNGSSVAKLELDRCVEQRLTVVYRFHKGRQEKLVRVPRKTKTVYVRGVPTAVDDCQACKLLLHWTQLVKDVDCVKRVEVFGSDGRLLLDLGSQQLVEDKDIWVETNHFKNPCSSSENEIVVKVNGKFTWRKRLDPIGEWVRSGVIHYERKDASNGILTWIHPKLTRCLSSASIVGPSEEKIALDKNFNELQLDPCKAHNLVIKYRFYSHEEVISKSVEIHEDGFYCQEQKLKERERKERQRVEKKRKEKEQQEKERQERIEKERTKQEKEEEERIDRERKESDVLEKERAEKENREGTTMEQGQEEEETEENPTTQTTTKGEGNRTSMESKSIDNEPSEKAQVEVITLIVAFAVLTTTIVLIASFICWQRRQSKKSNPHQVQSDQNHTYGTYARGPDGEGEYGDGDKVYVTDNNFYYGT